MSKTGGWLRKIAIGIAALIVLIGLAAIVIVQTDWFRGYVREKIISATEAGTGGRVELGSFSFNWRRLEAVVTNFVIHGKEPAGAAPFVSVARVQVNVRLFTSFRDFLDLTYLGVEQPKVNVITFADGSTNIPEPKEKTTSDTTVLDTVVDLAVSHFLISRGELSFNSQKQAIDVSGRNLRAELKFNSVKQSYEGEVSMQPIYVTAGKNTPVVFTVKLPLVLARTRIALEGATIATPASNITLNGSLEDLKHPKTDLRVKGHLALADLQKLADTPLELNGKNLPARVELDGAASVAENAITVDNFRVGLGGSSLVATGTLKDANGQGALNFKTALDLGELGRLTKSSARPEGVMTANGQAKLDAANNYQVTAQVAGSNLSFTQGDQRVRNVSISSDLSLDPHRLELERLHLSALGGQFDGLASLEEFRRYRLNGTLRNFDIETITKTLGQKPLPYSGAVGGTISAQGDTGIPGTKSLTANAKLNITPGKRGVPVSGRIVADFNGATDNVQVANSYIALPHSRLNLNGSLSNRLNLELTSRDLNDLLASASPATSSPVTLNNGSASFTGTLTGGLNAPRIGGSLAVTSFSVEGRHFDSLAADIAASKSRATLSNGLLLRGPMRTQFTASAGLQNWAPKPNQPLTAAVNVSQGDLADVMVLAGQPPAGYAGALSLNATVGGTIGNPTGSANVEVLKGTLQGEAFDRLQAKVNLADQLITIPSATLDAGKSQVNLTAEFRHPRESLSQGQLHAHLQTQHLNLSQLQALQRERPGSSGSVDLTADVNGNLTTHTTNGKEASEFLLSAVSVDGAARNLRFDGQNYGDLTLKADTSGQTVNYNVASNFAGSTVKVTGATQLTRDYPTTAEASLRNLPVERVLTLARRTDIQVRGQLFGTARVSGTMAKPEGSADLDLANALLYEEPVDHLRARVNYLSQRVDVALVEAVAGPSQIQLSGHFDHPVDNLKNGSLEFRVTSNRVELGRIRNLQKLRPGLGGALQLNATGAANVTEGDNPVVLKTLDGNLALNGVTAQGKNLGDVTLKAATNGGRLNVNLTSNLAEADIRGQGQAQLSGNLPVTAELNFSNVTWSRLRPLLGTATGQPPGFDVLTEGQLTLTGPVRKTDDLRGSLKLAKLQVNTVRTGAPGDRPLSITNQGPIVASLDHGVIRIDSAHLAGRQTDVNLTGTASLVEAQALSLNLAAKTNLAILKSFDQDIFSSGNIEANATVRGTLQKPLVTGQLQLQNASVNYVDLPNGISNANGSIVFSGNTATVRNMTAESGGGKVNLSGFVTYDEVLRLGLRVRANSVRVRTQQGVSVLATAFINLTGTSQSSLVSGNITINRITYAPQSDFGSILTRSAPPVQAAGASNPLLDHMRLDIRVRTSASTTVQASLAQNVQLDADLRIRGTATLPGVQGRVIITEGDLAFFGSQYRVSSGTIAFYNPTRIEPILNLSLETEAKGVKVILTVTGPVDDMKLSYTSDPPLQFQEIVSLLASGKTPTSDPTLLANQPSAPQQSFQQMGASALVSRAVADPVATRLKRVFGVSQLKIDPTFTSGSDLPQARMTLQQQIASNLTFTYVTALDDPNTQIVRVEWVLSPQWSALANRDANGIFSLNFVYKKKFR